MGGNQLFGDDNVVSKADYDKQIKGGIRNAFVAHRKSRQAKQVTTGSSATSTRQEQRAAKRTPAKTNLPDGTKVPVKYRSAYNAALKKAGGDPAKVSMSKLEPGKFQTHDTPGAALKSQTRKNKDARNKKKK